jgi:hypothetical protein
MSAFCGSPKYERWQREAIAAAYTRMTAGRVAELAASGELAHPSGARLSPFRVPEATIRSIAQRARHKQAAAEARVETVDLAPRNAVERLRRQLVMAIDTELSRIEIEQAEGRPITGAALPQVMRATWELAAIPGPDEPRPPAPRAKVNGLRRGGETRGGLAGPILAAYRAQERGFDAVREDPTEQAPAQAEAAPEVSITDEIIEYATSLGLKMPPR